MRPRAIEAANATGVLRASVPEAAAFVWAAVEGDEDGWSDRLAREHGITALPGRHFAAGDPHLRIPFGGRRQGARGAAGTARAARLTAGATLWPAAIGVPPGDGASHHLRRGRRRRRRRLRDPHRARGDDRGGRPAGPVALDRRRQGDRDRLGTHADLRQLCRRRSSTRSWPARTSSRQTGSSACATSGCATARPTAASPRSSDDRTPFAFTPEALPGSPRAAASSRTCRQRPSARTQGRHCRTG